MTGEDGSAPAAGRTGERAPAIEALVRVVAVDGPAGSGKSSVARETARALGWRFVDTGATYRAVTLAVLRAGVDPRDPVAVESVARAASVELVTDPGCPAVRLEGADVSDEIRGPDVTAAVSAVSKVPAVRGLLVSLQRAAMGTAGAVVEGRDIATVVAPHAGVKVYLDARPEVRARRRAGDVHSGVGATQLDAGDERGRESAVRVDLERRDALDTQTNLLAPSDGAVHIETSDSTLDEVVAVLVQLVRDARLVP